MVSISQDRSGILYAGTPFLFRCDITLSNFGTIPVTVSNQWTHNGNNVPVQDNTTITAGLSKTGNLEYEATLGFYPLNTADSGLYVCNVSVVTSFQYIQDTSAQSNASITVNDGRYCMCLYYHYYMYWYRL